MDQGRYETMQTAISQRRLNVTDANTEDGQLKIFDAAGGAANVRLALEYSLEAKPDDELAAAKRLALETISGIDRYKVAVSIKLTPNPQADQDMGWSLVMAVSHYVPRPLEE